MKNQNAEMNSIMQHNATIVHATGALWDFFTITLHNITTTFIYPREGIYIKKKKGAIGCVSVLTLNIPASNYNSELGQKACGLISSLFTGQSLASRQPARLENLANGAVKTNLTLT